MKQKLLLKTMLLLCALIVGLGNVWADETIASWGKVSIAANTAIKASNGDAK